MAKRFLTALDMTGNQLLNTSFEKLSSNPTENNFEGRMYFNTGSSKVFVFDGEEWNALGESLDIEGTEDQINVSSSEGTVTISLTDTVNVVEGLNVGTDLVVQGDFTVRGTTTFIETEDLNIKDNIITLNSGLEATTAPTMNAGVEVERGSSENVSLIWNETDDTWQATRNGSTFAAILLAGDSVPTSDITNFQENVEDVVGGMSQGSNSLSVTYSDNGASAGTLSFDTTLKSSDSYLSKTSGLAVDISTLETKLVTDSFTKKYSASVGNGTNTSFVLTHGLDTRDVQVQVYDNATYDTVEVDVLRNTANQVTVSFTSAPSNDAYRVVVVG